MLYARLTLLAATSLLAYGADAPSSAEFFESHVRPVLAKNCYACHSTTALGGLTLTSREAALKGGKSGPALVPGQPDESLMIQAVRHTHARLKMPPSGELAPNEVEALATWVKDGAVWPESKKIVAQPAGKEYVITPEQRAFWSFQPVRKPALPPVKDSKFVHGAIDQFILAKLEEKGLKPVAPADRRTLIRRATYDLTGLPPTPEEVEAFLNDRSPDAFAKVVDRLLASPQYGERWGRHWLDVARYADDKLNSTMDDPYPNAFRYRDWVVSSFNQDLPYDVFLKAQLAGDLLPQKEKLIAGLGFYALSPEFQDDRVDATTRGFLGLTVACAQCHDHKFDPIPTKDYYSLLSVFNNTKHSEYPLAPAEQVEQYKKAKAKLDTKTEEWTEFLKTQGDQLAQMLAAKTSRYVMAAWQVIGPAQTKVKETAAQEKLDEETLERWVKYLQKKDREHPLLKGWDDLVAQKADDAKVRAYAEGLQEQLLSLNKEKRGIDDQNNIRLGGSRERNNLSNADLLSLERNKFFLWKDVFSPQRGVLFYKDKALERWLQGEWKDRYTGFQAELEQAKAAVPPQYPFLHTVADVEKPKTGHVWLRGNKDTPGEEVPRRFLRILSEGEPKPFEKGVGRLELAEAIASPKNPLTARVMVNRVWERHFGAGIVTTPSNFGQLGERPTHPELLDYLASSFMEQGWSLKKLHREIMLSATYALSNANNDANFAADPDNRLLWRMNRRRVDAEALRDSLLFVSKELDTTAGGPPVKLSDEKNYRRTLYCNISRRALDPTLLLFDFPNPNNTSEQRIVTSTPLQRLFFLNSPFVMQRAEKLAQRLSGDDDAKIRAAYRLLYQRAPTDQEMQLGLEFLRSSQNAWPQYAQVLLGANEFLFVE